MRRPQHRTLKRPGRRRLSVVAAAALVAVAFAVAVAGCRRPEGPRRVFLITVDTLRADHLGAYGYPRATSPALDGLASGAIVFDRAIAQWPKTGASFASLWSGRYPQTTGLTHSAAIRVPSEHLTLPEFFRDRGYATAAVVSNPVLTSRLGWNDGFDEFLETWQGSPTTEDPELHRALMNAPRVNALALPLLDRLRDERRVFVWLHYSDPHAPYTLPPGVANPFLDDAWYAGDATVPISEGRGKLIGDRRELKFYVAQYDANVLVVDRAVDEVMRRARELGLLDDALVVFTADHGESLGEHDAYLEHGPLPYNETSRVPLFFDFPGGGRAPRRVATPVELVDVYPTLRDLVAPGAKVDGLEGESLAPLRAPAPAGAPASGVAFAEAGKRSPHTHYRSVQDQAWKLIHHQAPGGGGERYELYDLEGDPGETSDLAMSRTDELRRLRRALLAWTKEVPWTPDLEAAAARNDREVRRALRALGYVR